MASRYSPSFASWDNVAGVTNAASSSMINAANAFNQGAVTTTTIGNELEKMHNKALKKREEELKAIGERQKEQLWLSSRRSDGSVDAAKYTEGLNALEQTFRSVNQEPNYMNTDVKNLLGDTKVEELYNAEATRRKQNIASAGNNARNEAMKQATLSNGKYNTKLYKKIIADHLKKTEEIYGTLSDSERAMFNTGTTDSYNTSTSGSTTTNNLGGVEGAMYEANEKIDLEQAEAEGKIFFQGLQKTFSQDDVMLQSRIEQAMTDKLDELRKQGWSNTRLAAFASEYYKHYTADNIIKESQIENAYYFKQKVAAGEKAANALTELAVSSDKLSGFVKGTDGIYQNKALAEKLAPIFNLDSNAEEQFNYVLAAFKAIDENDKIVGDDKNTAKERVLFEFSQKIEKIFTSDNIRVLAEQHNVDASLFIQGRQAAEQHALKLEEDIRKREQDALNNTYGITVKTADGTTTDTLAKTLNGVSVSTLDDKVRQPIDEAAKSLATAITELHGKGPYDALALAESFILQRINVDDDKELTEESEKWLAAMIKNPFKVKEFKDKFRENFANKMYKFDNLATNYKEQGGTTPTTQLSHVAENEKEYINTVGKNFYEAINRPISEDVNAASLYLNEARNRVNKLAHYKERHAVMAAAYENVSPLIFNMLVSVSPTLQHDAILQDALKEFINKEIIHGHGVVWDANTNKEYLGEIGDDFKSKAIRKELVKGYDKLSPEQRKLLDDLLEFRAGNYTIGNMFKAIADLL